MYLLYKKFKNTDPSDRSERVVEADILNIVSKEDKAYISYNQKIQEHNSNEKSAFEYVIKEVEDDSLIAFLARDRKYDLEKYENTADTLYHKIEDMLNTVAKLDIFYREAYNHQAAVEPTVPLSQNIAMEPQTDLHEKESKNSNI